MKRRTRRNPFTHLYKTLGGNNNYSRFVLFASVFRSASQTRGSARERRGVGSGEKERGEEKRRRGGRRWVRRLSAGLFLRFEHAFCRSANTGELTRLATIAKITPWKSSWAETGRHSIDPICSHLPLIPPSLLHFFSPFFPFLFLFSSFTLAARTTFRPSENPSADRTWFISRWYLRTNIFLMEIGIALTRPKLPSLPRHRSPG